MHALPPAVLELPTAPSASRILLTALLRRKEKKGSQSGLEEIWNYHCTSEDSINTTFKQGGNFMELRDGCFLVCMGGSYGKTFILDKNKFSPFASFWKQIKLFQLPVV